MSSRPHEGLVEVFRNRPELALGLLEQSAPIGLAGGDTRVEEADVTQVLPTEYRADLVIAATNPDPAFPAESGLSSDGRGSQVLARIERSKATKLAWRALARTMRFAGAARPRTNRQLLTWASERLADLLDMGALTIPSNIYGNPAISIPVGHVDGLPIGMQVLARHYEDALLLDVARSVEQDRPWPLVAPGSPR